MCDLAATWLLSSPDGALTDGVSPHSASLSDGGVKVRVETAESAELLESGGGLEMQQRSRGPGACTYISPDTGCLIGAEKQTQAHLQEGSG